MATLAACTGCGRHIRISETTCPFCGTTATPRVIAQADVSSAGRPLTRAAILFAGATAIAGCGKTTDNMPAPAYGVPVPPDTLVMEAGPPPDAGMMTAPAYGVPPPAPDLAPPTPVPNSAGSGAPKPPPPKKK